jgi:type I restriction enzyme, S subunit
VWRETTLGEVLTLQRGFDITKKEQRPGSVPVISSSGVGSYHDEARAQGPGVVIGRKGSLGTVFFVDRPYWPHDTTLWVKDFKGNDPYFCYLLLKTLPLAVLDAGSSNPTLNRNHAHLLPVRVPPVVEQQRIGVALAAFDELTETNERRIELLEDLGRSIYREWFVRFRFPGWEEEPFTDTPLGRTPAEWQVDRLAKFVTTQYGYTASATEASVGPRFLRGTDINKRSYINWAEVPNCEIPLGQIARFRLEVGDVCVIRMADPGKVGIVERPVDAVFASYLVRLRSVDSRLTPQLLAHYARDEPYQSWVTGSSTGTTRKSASASVLTEPRIAVPPAHIADRFEREVGAVRAELNALVEQNSVLLRTRDLLLPRIVTGRLDISKVNLGSLLSDNHR